MQLTVPLRRRFLLGAASLLLLLGQGVASDALAQRSSGGYSRPSTSSRTPSFRSSPSYSRTPSTSGGYGRPSSDSGRTPSFRSYSFNPSAGDRSYSQERSGDALRNYRTQQEESRRPAPQYEPRPGYQAPSYGSPSYPSPSYGGGSGYAPPSYRGYAAGRPNWYMDRGWATPPAYQYAAPRSFGVWDGLFLWTLLNNLSRPGSSDFFYNRQNDPGYQQWRAEADRLAQDNADLRQKLSALDQELAGRQGQPRDPEYLPPDVPPAVARAQPPSRTPTVQANPFEQPARHGGSLTVWLVVLGGLGVIGFLAWRRIRPSAPAGSSGGGPMTPLQTAGTILGRKLSGETYTPEKFRVGMTLSVDPTPFILAANTVKLRQPDASGPVTSVRAVGRVGQGPSQLFRLYLPDDRSMVQVHLDAGGTPDECRLFGTIDEVTPADADEWGVWLDPQEGLIGWPEFQTKDGKVYGRVWSPGGSRIEPRSLDETIEAVEGKHTVRSMAMLYGAPTGAAEPAPQTEYILVSAVEAGNRAWVEIRSGIDVSPATLQLS